MPPRRETAFARIVVLDFEYEIEDGGLPNVLCMVAYMLDCESPAHRDHPTLARRVRHLAAVRYRTTTRWSSAIRCGPR